jgi:glutamate synthase domain-containing protein 2
MIMWINMSVNETKAILLCHLDSLKNKKPAHKLVRNTDLVIINFDGKINVFYGRCLHRGALLSDGSIEGNNLVCGLHGWDYRVDSGISEYNNDEKLYRFTSWVENENVYIDDYEVIQFERFNPQPFKRDEYLGVYVSTHDDEAEPENKYIQSLSKHGLRSSHGELTAMGVSRTLLPSWNDIQILPAQLAKFPLLDDALVDTTLVIGPKAKKPLKLEIPLFVSDMSFGSLSEESKIALAMGAEMAGTGICSGEGGMLPEEQENNTRYFYELASAKFGFENDLLKKVQAFHFKGGQGAKTGTGGHLPGGKVKGKIAKVRKLPEGKPAISPARFTDFKTINDFKDFSDQVRSITGGIPVGFKLSANHIEKDIGAALKIGVDYIILDGRGGGTGAAPKIFRDHISVPTIPALARARMFLNEKGITNDDVTLIITGGLRTAPDFVKAMSLGADGVAIANSAIQAIGCQAMRACHTNNCPVGIATQKEELRKRLDIVKSALRLKNFLTGSVDLMKVLARSCGHDSLSKFNSNDLTTFNYYMSKLSGVKFVGLKF